jgi:hypothetical protein
VNLDQSLLKYEKPKLYLFKNRKIFIKFIKFLSESDPKKNYDENPKENGHIFKILINFKSYILKIMRRIFGINIIRYSELIILL